MKCFKCGLDSEELVWKKLESSPKTVIWHEGQGRPHDCSPKPAEPEKMIKCPKCDPLTRKAMTAKKLQDHIMKEHIDWVDYR